MDRLYAELYNRIEQYKKTHNRAGAISLHVPMVGRRYNDQPVRMMWIGRAVNGWKPELFDQPPDVYLDSISQLRQHDDRFSRFINQQDFNFRRSPFWRNCKLLHQQLHHLSLPAADWYEDVAWANLYWAAPADGGNPCTSLCAAQQDVCHQLLTAQIALLNPTHIVFITDWDWFRDSCPVSAPSDCAFADVQRVSTDDGVVVAAGTIGTSKAIVTRRPEFRISDKDFTAAVLNAFNTL